LVRGIVRLPVVESTNNFARQMLQDRLEELPLLVWADRQTMGRGRGENQWWSDEGSLTCTIALDPAAHRLRIDQQPRLALAAAVAVVEAIGLLGLSDPGLGIRWPNDIEARGGKLGGILPERVETPYGDRLLIGIGINVFTQIESAPPDVQRVGASLCDLRRLSSGSFSMEDFLAAILSRFELVLQRITSGDPELARSWDRWNLLRGHAVQVDVGLKIVRGIVREIDAQGALSVFDGQQIQRLFGGRVLRQPHSDAS
jgi:BirA family biotin operon repressor/biotin-[acetyl-CoA-carboxylase] ligase